MQSQNSRSFSSESQNLSGVMREFTGCQEFWLKPTLSKYEVRQTIPRYYCEHPELVPAAPTNISVNCLLAFPGSGFGAKSERRRAGIERCHASKSHPAISSVIQKQTLISVSRIRECGFQNEMAFGFSRLQPQRVESSGCGNSVTPNTTYLFFDASTIRLQGLRHFTGEVRS